MRQAAQAVTEHEGLPPVISNPPYSGIKDVTREVCHEVIQTEETARSQVPERPHSPPKPVIPQYAPPPPPVTPAPPSTPVWDSKPITASQIRSQIILNAQPKCAATEDTVSQITPARIYTGPAVYQSPEFTSHLVQPKIALLDQRMAGLVGSVIPAPIEDDRKATPPQTGLVTPPETPPTSFQENAQERRSKRKSVPPAHDDVIRGSILINKPRGTVPVDEIVPTTERAKPTTYRLPGPTRLNVRDEVPLIPVQVEPTSTEAFSVPRPTTPVPEGGRDPMPLNTSKADTHAAIVEEPPVCLHE